MELSLKVCVAYFDCYVQFPNLCDIISCFILNFSHGWCKFLSDPTVGYHCNDIKIHCYKGIYF